MDNYDAFNVPIESTDDILSADLIVDQIIKELRENENDNRANGSTLSFQLSTEYIDQINRNAPIGAGLPNFQQSFGLNTGFYTIDNNSSYLPQTAHSSMEVYGQNSSASNLPDYEKYSSSMEDDNAVLKNDPNLNVATSYPESISVQAAPLHYERSELITSPVENLFQNYQLVEMSQPYDSLSRPLLSEVNIGTPEGDKTEIPDSASTVLKITAPTFVGNIQTRKKRKQKIVEPESDPAFRLGNLQYLEDGISNVVQYLNVNEENIAESPICFVQNINMASVSNQLNVNVDESTGTIAVADSPASNHSSSIAKDENSNKVVKIIRKEPLRTIRDLETTSNEKDDFKFLQATSNETDNFKFIQTASTIIIPRQRDTSPDEKKPIIPPPRCRKRKQTFSGVAKNSENWDEVVIESTIQQKQHKRKKVTTMTWDEFEASMNEDTNATSEKLKKVSCTDQVEDFQNGYYCDVEDDLPLTFIPRNNNEDYFGDRENSLEGDKSPKSSDINGNDCGIKPKQHQKLTAALINRIKGSKKSEKVKVTEKVDSLIKNPKLESQDKPIIIFENNAKSSETYTAGIIKEKQNYPKNTQKILLSGSGKKYRRHSTRTQRIPVKTEKPEDAMAVKIINSPQIQKIEAVNQLSRRISTRIQSSFIQKEKINQPKNDTIQDPLRLLCQYCSTFVEDINSHYKKCAFLGKAGTDDNKNINIVPKADTSNFKTLRNRSVKIEAVVKKSRRSNNQTDKNEMLKEKPKVTRIDLQKDTQAQPNQVNVEEKKPQTQIQTRKSVVRQENQPTNQFNLRSRNGNKKKAAGCSREVELLKIATRNLTRSKKKDNWTCKLCQRTYRKESYLEAHNSSVHDLTVCAKCSQTFPQFDLKRHIQKCQKR